MIFLPLKTIFFIIFCAIFVGCGSKDSEDSQNLQDSQQDSIHDSQNLKDSQNQEDITNQDWLFNTRYVKNLQNLKSQESKSHGAKWEQIYITPLNNYKDFKIDFTFISTGRPQNCTLYSKGIFMNNAMYSQKDVKNKKKILFRPNLISKTTIIFSQSRFNKNAMQVEISNMDEFIHTCGMAHKDVAGEYGVGN